MNALARTLARLHVASEMEGGERDKALAAIDESPDVEKHSGESERPHSGAPKVKESGYVDTSWQKPDEYEFPRFAFERQHGRDGEAGANKPKKHAEGVKPRKFGNTMILLPPDVAAGIKKMAASIPEGDLADDGREDEPHVTVKYGLHDDDPEAVREALAGVGPIKGKIGGLSLFPAKEGADYDVLKLDIDSPDLHVANKAIADACPHTNTHPQYVPHATLAYVKAGMGGKYLTMANPLKGRDFTADGVVFSDRSRNKTTIPLGKVDKHAETEDDGGDYAAWACSLLNQILRAGGKDEAERASEALAESLDAAGWAVAYDPRRGRYVAAPSERDPAFDEFAERAPKGGTSINGKQYRGGMFIPSSAIKEAEQKAASGDEKAKAELSHLKSGKAAESARLEKRGPVDREKLAAKLKHDGTDASPLQGYHARQAAASARALFAHHGDLALHRIDEIADAVRGAMDKTEDPDEKARLGQRLAGLAHAVSMEGDWKEKQANKDVPGKPPKTPKPGQVYNVDTGELKVDPSRFQFKLNTDRTGVTSEFKGVDKFNPDFAGVISVWKDPADGQTYVVNGHHRHELASRLGHPGLAVRYVDAPDAKTARATGALINMAEGRGTAVDAAKFMRDAGVGPDELRKRGVSLKGKLADDAVALTALSDRQFNRLARGQMDEGKALAVARHLPDHAMQDQLFGLLDKREDAGKDISNRVIEEMAREMAATPKIVKGADPNDMFGGESEESLFVQRAEVKAHVRAELASEMNDYLAVASKRRAERVAGAGNKLDTETNRGLADEAARAKNVYDTLVNSRGPVSDAINAAAERLANAKTRGERDAAKRDAAGAARAAIRRELGETQPGGTGPGVRGGGGGVVGGQAPAEAPDAAGRGPEPDGLKEEILGHLKANPRTSLADLRQRFGGGLKVDKDNPLAHPVHGALKGLRDSGDIEAHESERGEPSFSAKPPLSPERTPLPAGPTALPELPIGPPTKPLEGGKPRDLSKPSPSGRVIPGAAKIAGTDPVADAVSKLTGPGGHVSTADQAEQAAQNHWFNNGEAQKAFKDRKAFGKAVREAWETKNAPAAKSFKGAGHASDELQAIRNDLASGGDGPALQGRVDAVGKWAAAQKNSRAVAKILDEAHVLSDKLAGGTGAGGLKVKIAEPDPLPPAVKADPTIPPERLAAAQARYANRDKTAKGGGIFGGEDLQAGEGFGRLPDGAKILYTEGRHAGKTGRIVHESNGQGGTHITTKVDGEDTTTPVMPSAIEPLDAHLSWRTEQAGPSVKQEGLGLGMGVAPKAHPVDEVKKKLNAVASKGGTGEVDGHAVQMAGIGQWKATIGGRAVSGSLAQVAQEIHDANERAGKKAPAPAPTGLPDLAPSPAPAAPNPTPLPEVPILPKAETPAPDVMGAGVSQKDKKFVSWPFHGDTVAAIREGRMTADELRRRFDALTADPDAVKASLAKALKATGLRSPDKIRDNAEYLYERALSALTPGKDISYRVAMGDRAEGERAKAEAYRKAVGEIDDAHLAKVAEGHKASGAAFQKAMNNPETLREFETFISRKGEAALTSEQRAAYDHALATGRREADSAEQSRRAVVAPVTSAQGYSIHEGMHTKHNTPIHVVKPDARVDAASFKGLAEAARKLGGNYQPNSRYTGGATPDGFNFPTREAAERFGKLMGGEAVSRADDWEESRGESRQGAAARLLELSARTKARAEEEISRDRLTNTARRADMAAGIEARAKASAAFADTTARIADKVASGEAGHLAGLRTGTQIEALDSAMRQAQYARQRKANKWDQDEPPASGDIDHAIYPHPFFDKGDLLRLAGSMRATPGAKRMAERIAKVAAKMGDEGQRLDDRSFLADMADVAKNPSAYGLDRHQGDRVRGQMNNYMRLQASDIKTLPELRAALREYLPLRQGVAKPDAVKVAERALIGRPIPGFFPTPRPVVDDMLSRADIRPGMSVLEPSAGKGDILDAVRESVPDAKTAAVEINGDLRGLLQAKGHTLAGDDFNAHQGEYDRIVMNPPFENGQDADHIRHAYSMLKPGGKLVAISSEGPFFREDGKARGFRDWLQSVGGESEKMPEGSFAGKDAFRQTGVRTRMVTITKPDAPASPPAPAPAQTGLPELAPRIAPAAPAAAPPLPPVVTPPTMPPSGGNKGGGMSKRYKTPAGDMDDAAIRQIDEYASRMKAASAGDRPGVGGTSSEGMYAKQLGTIAAAARKALAGELSRKEAEEARAAMSISLMSPARAGDAAKALRAMHAAFGKVMGGEKPED